MNTGAYKWYTKEEVSSWPAEHKKCRGCQRTLPLSLFHKQKQTLFGVNNYCKECRHPKSATNYGLQSWEQRLFNRAKTRATKKGLPFTIKLEDIVIPETCPVLNKEITLVPHSTYAPSLDQINPSKGYTPGNIIVMSWRANTLKNNASKEEARLLADWMEKNCNWTNIKA